MVCWDTLCNSKDTVVSVIKTWERRELMPIQHSKGNVIQTGDFILDLNNTTLLKGEDAFHLTPKEAKLMAVLMENVEHVVGRARLTQEVWHTDEPDGSRTLDVHVHWLRQKIEDNPRIPEYILTRRGLGYELRLGG